MTRRHINRYIDLINRKVPKTKNPFKLFKYLKHKREIKKLYNELIHCSPSFPDLWSMADFIKLSEHIYFYNNNVKCSDIGIYSSRGYADGENGFKITTPDCTIVVKLVAETKRVMLEIDRKTGSGYKTFMSFLDEQWEQEPDSYDEMLLDQTISIIANKIIELFEWCYERKCQ